MFDCVYCHYGPTQQTEGGFPTADAVLTAVEARLRQDREFDFITLAGNGEPTMHPEFSTILRGIVELREEICKEKPIALLTNSATITSTDMRELIQLVDKPMFKLDAADQHTFLLMNRPRRSVSISEIVDNLALLDSPIIQTMLIHCSVTNATGKSWSNLIEALRKIAPAEVQLYTIDFPIPETGIKPVAAEILHSRAAELKNRFGINATVFT